MKKILFSLLLIPSLVPSMHAGSDSDLRRAEAPQAVETPAAADDVDKKRKLATQTLEELRLIDAAIDQYAIENNKPDNSPVTWDQIKLYLKTGTRIYDCNGKDPLGNLYSGGKFTVGHVPKLSAVTFKALFDVANEKFWSPYF